MLDAYVIEEIRRKEQGHRDDRPAVELPLPAPEPVRQDDSREPERPDRGVVIIDYTG